MTHFHHLSYDDHNDQCYTQLFESVDLTPPRYGNYSLEIRATDKGLQPNSASAVYNVNLLHHIIYLGQMQNLARHGKIDHLQYSYLVLHGHIMIHIKFT